MKIVSTRRVITRQAYQFTVFGFGGIAFGVFLFALATLLRSLPLAVPGSSSDVTIQNVVNIMRVFSFVTASAGLAAVVRGLTFKRDHPLAARVADVLGRALDDNYTFIRSINTLRLGYIDAVLVGPPGVLVFRIVGRGGTLLHEGEKWLRPGPDGDWLPAGFNATRECIIDMRAVKGHLQRKNIQTDAVFGVAVLVGDAKITEKSPVLPGVTLDQLMDRLRAGYMAKRRLEPAIANAITDLLSGD